MALADGIRFIWLDTHIGKEEEYNEFKKQFRDALEPTITMPPDAINSLICALDLNVAPFLFADTHDKAMALIKEHHDKKIIFISSGSLGQHSIPIIIATYPQVHSFYFFCQDMAKYIDFADDYLNCLQIFDHEIDLLVKLVRDISKDIITQGKVYIDLEDAKCALKCFLHAQTLNVTANRVDTLNPPYNGQLRELENHGSNIGLIQQAENMLNQQQSQQ
jgi:hypothetical protein